ncbi:MAG: AAA family ATPase [Candidatus Aenigmatarchaeota archaeon]
MSYYVIIRGPAGVGKTTIAKTLAKKLDAKYISFDTIMKKHKLDIVNGSCISRKNFITANKIILKSITKKSAILDGCFYHKSQLNHLIKNLPEPPIVFTLSAPIITCINRDEKRKSIGKKSVIAVHKLVSRFDYGYVIETKNMRPKETIDRMLNIIKK